MAKDRETTGEISFHPIGVVRTPYRTWAPNQPVEQEKGIGDFRVVLHEPYREALGDLDRFRYVMLITSLDRVEGKPEMIVSPPWAKGRRAGLFATRTPLRPNPIGLSIVRLVRIEQNQIITWPIDLLDGTPLLDIKPYFLDLDAKSDANNGWVEDIEGAAHLLEHVRGIPHHHHHDHDHDHDTATEHGTTESAAKPSHSHHAHHHHDSQDEDPKKKK